MTRLGLAEDDLVRISSRRGHAVMKARSSEEQRPGDAFVAMHWGSRFTGGSGTNGLTLPAVDPFSRQPELKNAAVRVERFEAAWRRTMVAPASAELTRWVAPHLARFDYAALALAGETLVLELASVTAPPSTLLAPLEPFFTPADGLPRRRAICACLDVSEEAVRAAIAAGATLPSLQNELRCGTECGSCVTELRGLIGPALPATTIPAAAARL
jgi:bacterioferritin-associated ferredoxin